MCFVLWLMAAKSCGGEKKGGGRDWRRGRKGKGGERREKEISQREKGSLPSSPPCHMVGTAAGSVWQIGIVTNSSKKAGP